MDQRGKELIASTNSNSGMSRRPTIQTKANQTLHAAPMSTKICKENVKMMMSRECRPPLGEIHQAKFLIRSFLSFLSFLCLLNLEWL